MKFIVLLGLLMFVVAARSDRMFCIPFIPLVENGCNPCRCPFTLELHQVTCDTVPCANKDYGIRKQCLERQKAPTWLENCNRCWCIPGKGSICEERKCAL